MAKRKIPVENEIIKVLKSGVKENELIKTLNENLNKNKISPSQESLENNTKIKSDVELNDDAREVYDSCGTEIVKNDISTFDKIESDRQREIKCNVHADKIGYANATPSPVCNNAMVFKDLSPEAIEKLKNVISPVANSILERFDNLKNTLKDNEECRKVVNSEVSHKDSDDWISPSNLTDYGKKVFEAGKKAGRLVTGKETEYEMVNHPSHYNQYDIEVIDMIIKIWGPEAAALWCDITAFKYRMRMGTKPDNSIEQDIKKEQWYLNKAKEIRASIVRENLINKN